MGVFSPIRGIIWTRLLSTYRRNNDPKSGAFLVGLVVIGSYVVVRPGGQGAYYYGTLLAQQDHATVKSGVATGVTAIGLTMFALFMFRSSTKAAKFLDIDAFVSISVSRKVHLAGKILYEYVAILLFVSVPLLAGVVAFGVGSRSPLNSVSMLISMASLVAAASFVASPLGFALNYPFQRYDLPRGIKYFFGIIAFLGFEAVIVYRDTVIPFLEGPPFSWYADLALIFVPGLETSVQSALFALLIPVLLFPVSVVLSVRLVGVVWFTEGPALIEHEGESGDGVVQTSSKLFALESEYLSSRTLTLTHLTWKRSLRSPYSIGFSLLTLSFIALLGYQSMRNGKLPVEYTISVAVLGPIALGNLSYTLNLLGDDRDALPFLFTTNITTKEYILGKSLAGTLFAAPVALLAVGVAIGFTPALSSVQTAMVVMICLSLIVAAPFLSILCGIYFPNTEKGEVVRGVQTALPSKKASLIYTTVMFLIYIPGGGSVLSMQLSSVDPAPTELLFGLMLTVLGAGITAHVSFHHTLSVFSKTSAFNTASRESPASLKTALFSALREAHQHDSRSEKFEREASVLKTSATAIAIVFTFIAIGSFFVLTVSLVGGSEIANYRPVGSMLSALSAGIVAIGYMTIHRNGLHYIDARTLAYRDIVPVAAGVAALLTLQVTIAVLANSFGAGISNEGVRSMSDQTFMLILPVAVLLVAPLEELLFRNIIQKRISEGFGPGIAILGASVLFTLPHIPNFVGTAPEQIAIRLVQVFLSSIILGFVFARYENIYINVLVHSTFNMLSLLLLYASFFNFLLP